MNIYMVRVFSDLQDRMVAHIQNFSPDIDSFPAFDENFYRLRLNDLIRMFNNSLYGCSDADLNALDFSRRSVSSFFTSTNSDFWLTGTDLMTHLEGMCGLGLLNYETTEAQGKQFAEKLYNAYATNEKKFKDVLSNGVPDAVVVFDPYIELVMDPLPFLRGIMTVEKKQNVGPKLYVFGGSFG